MAPSKKGLNMSATVPVIESLQHDHNIMRSRKVKQEPKLVTAHLVVNTKRPL